MPGSENKAFLIFASENGDKNAVELSLNDRAEVNSKDSKGRTALIAASENGHSAITNLLIKGGACIDLQDDEGCSALITACKNGHVQVASQLLEEGADTFLKDNEGKTALDIAVEKNDSNVLHVLAKLRSNPNHSGILFSEGVKREIVITEEKTIDLEEVGISLSIPKDTLSSTDPPLELKIQPCFSGPFEAPQGVELVSPAYIVKPSRKVSFNKEVLVKIWHHANLETEEDCEDMVFLSASTTPEYQGNSPVYIFREIRGAKGLFRPGEEQPVGEITLKHFCTLALGKRNRQGDQAEKNLYSVRIYRAIEKKLVFCICLYQPQYIKNCNKVIAAKYGTPEKQMNPSECFNGVKIISSEVNLRQTCDSGWTAVFKKRPASILKEEIHTQELYDISDLLEMDYPPKIEIAVQSVPDSPDAGPLYLHVEGLDRESTFILYPSDIIVFPTLCLDTSKITCAMSDLRKELQEQDQSRHLTPGPVATLLPTAAIMLVTMENIEQLLLHTCGHVDSVRSLMLKLDEMERKSKQLLEDTTQILHELKLSYDIDIYVERVNTLAVQMRKVFIANMTHSHSPEWRSAIGLFVVNAANLMTAIKDTLRAAKWALTLPNNYTPSVSSSSPPVAAQLPPTNSITARGKLLSHSEENSNSELSSNLGSSAFNTSPLSHDAMCHQQLSINQPSALTVGSTTAQTLPPHASFSTTTTCQQIPEVTPKPRQKPLPRYPHRAATQPHLAAPTELPPRLPSAQPLLPGPPKPLPRRPRNLSQKLTPKPRTLQPGTPLPPKPHPRCPRSLAQYPKPPPQPLSLDPALAKPLNKDHTAEVYRFLFSMRARWETIGTLLHIDRGTLEAIETDKKDSNDKLLELIAVWLKRHTPPPTWQALEDAVQYIDPDKAQEEKNMCP